MHTILPTECSTIQVDSNVLDFVACSIAFQMYSITFRSEELVENAKTHINAHVTTM